MKDQVTTILVVAATQRELEGLRREVTRVRAATTPKENFQGEIGDLQVVAAVTGVGKSNASMSTLELLTNNAADLVINLGCGGAFGESGLAVGDVVVADRVIFADEGVETAAGFLDLKEINLPIGRDSHGDQLYNVLPTDLGDFNPSTLPRDLGFTVRIGPIATVSTVSGSQPSATRLFNRWRPLLEAMEGAAVALAASRCRCPFWEIRGVSNRVGSRDPGSWEIDRACANASRVLREIISARLRRSERFVRKKP